MKKNNSPVGKKELLKAITQQMVATDEMTMSMITMLYKQWPCSPTCIYAQQPTPPHLYNQVPGSNPGLRTYEPSQTVGGDYQLLVQGERRTKFRVHYPSISVLALIIGSPSNYSTWAWDRTLSLRDMHTVYCIHLDSEFLMQQGRWV